jgi:hypothetical protein
MLYLQCLLPLRVASGTQFGWPMARCRIGISRGLLFRSSGRRVQRGRDDATASNPALARQVARRTRSLRIWRDEQVLPLQGHKARSLSKRLPSLARLAVP